MDMGWLNGGNRMITGAAVRFISALVIVMFGYVAGTSFGVKHAKASTLSKALSQVELFSVLTDAEKDALKDAVTMQRGKAGDRIIRQGETLDRMFIILKSEAEVRVNGKPVATLTGQPLVGEIEFLDGLSAAADVVLLKETDFIELNFAKLTALMQKQPRLAYVLMREIAEIEARRLRKTTSN
jgi:signal-transduction protein with cAMP-binding, CBS, and nucleotidyltransferase domain